MVRHTFSSIAGSSQCQRTRNAAWLHGLTVVGALDPYSGVWRGGRQGKLRPSYCQECVLIWNQAATLFTERRRTVLLETMIDLIEEGWQVRGLTEDAADGVSAVALEIEKGRNTDNKLVQEAAEGPQVWLPAVLLLEEELGWWVLERAEEGRRGDLWALFSRRDWRTWNWTGARRIVCDRFRLPRVVAVLWR